MPFISPNKMIFVYRCTICLLLSVIQILSGNNLNMKKEKNMNYSTKQLLFLHVSVIPGEKCLSSRESLHGVP